MAVVDYARHLDRQLAELRSARKVERTRLRLEIATAELLARTTYARLTVDEITEAAGLAHGTFYRYYAGKHEIVLAVLRGFLGSIRGMRESLSKVADPYEAIHAANRHYVEVYRHNVGLMRCLLTLRTDDPLVAEAGSQADAGLVARVIRSIARFGAPASRLPLRQQELLIHAVIGTVDALLRKVYGASEPPLARFADDPEAITRALTDIWFRALYAPGPAAAAPIAPATAGSAAGARRKRASRPA
ncbi:hypothetical protein STVA_50800 [Allostella vacuolata]|nr:hypothetical protein STVA_50800 [Stella vacuolata]